MVNVPGGIRTPNLLIRSQLLYPVELQTHRFIACPETQTELKHFLRWKTKQWVRNRCILLAAASWKLALPLLQRINFHQRQTPTVLSLFLRQLDDAGPILQVTVRLQLGNLSQVKLRGAI